MGWEKLNGNPAEIRVTIATSQELASTKLAAVMAQGLDPWAAPRWLSGRLNYPGVLTNGQTKHQGFWRPTPLLPINFILS